MLPRREMIFPIELALSRSSVARVTREPAVFLLRPISARLPQKNEGQQVRGSTKNL
jgi:hypothetical protein